MMKYVSLTFALIAITIILKIVVNLFKQEKDMKEIKLTDLSRIWTTSNILKTEQAAESKPEAIVLTETLNKSVKELFNKPSVVEDLKPEATFNLDKFINSLFERVNIADVNGIYKIFTLNYKVYIVKSGFTSLMNDLNLDNISDDDVIKALMEERYLSEGFTKYQVNFIDNSKSFSSLYLELDIVYLQDIENRKGKKFNIKSLEKLTRSE